MNVQTLRGWIAGRMAEMVGMEELPRGHERMRFQSYGIESKHVAVLAQELETLLGRSVPATLFWEHANLDELCRALIEPIHRSAGAAPGRPHASEPIAVVGIACRFPGGANDLCSFWRLLEEGRDAIGSLPQQRGGDPALTGGFLDDIAGFDPLFFGVSPEEARAIDPQQRIMLELSWSALEDAGIAPSSLRGSSTGVYFGVIWNDYATLTRVRGEAIDRHTATGSHASIVANRVSYVLGLEGPSMAIDTACSASLVSVHVACQALRSGDADLALAGGVNLIAAEESSLAMRALGATSPSGRVRAFDARGDGYVRAEGAGVIVLMPLSRALASGARIHCLIRGTAINNDGYSNGLTAPSPSAQRRVLRSALARAGLTAEDIQYVEAHGTGTPVGDPIEAGALGEVLGRERREPLRIGSVKTNIGHTEAAAGIAGFIKTALSLSHRRLPATLHFEAPNRTIDLAGLNLAVQARSEPWPACDVARAGVSSFGFGGTNAHAILEEPPRGRRMPRERRADLVFCFSGQGGLWPGVARDLLHAEPVFRARFEACSERIERLTGWSALAHVAEAREIDDDTVSQPLLFAIQVALAELLLDLGVRPRAVVGHSAGEIAAAHVAGALDLDDAVRLMSARGRVCASAEGRAAFVPLDREIVSGELTRRGDLYLAAVNGPDACIVSGTQRAVEGYVAELEARGVRASLLAVRFACHSPLVRAASEQLAQQIAGIEPRAPRVPMFSTTTGEALMLPPGPDYWARNLRDPVRFADVVAQLEVRGMTRLVEIGPHPILSRSIESMLGAGSVHAPLERGEPATETLARMIEAVGEPSHELDPKEVHLLPISAHTPAALAQACRETAAILRNDQDVSVVDLCHTVARCRSEHPHRIAVTGDSAEALAGALDEQARSVPAEASERAPLVFVFPGQGSQWPGMGRALLSEPAFRNAIEACDALVRAHAGWSVLDEMHADPIGSRLAEVERAQPMIFSLQVALAAQWRAWKIEPDAVVGHSMGEIAAAQVAGVLSLEDAVRVICSRSRLAGRARGRGRMALAGLPIEEASRVAGAHGLSIAAHNGPSSVVLAGGASAVREAIAGLEQRGVFTRMVQVDYASHSEHVEPLLPELRAALADLAPQDATIPFHSTVDGFDRNPRADTEYWCANLRRTVRFHPAIVKLLREGHGAFLEVSPHPVLVHAVEDAIRAEGKRAIAAVSLRRDTGRDQLLASLGQLYAHGFDPEWSRALVPGRVTSLPPYPFQRRRYWIGEPLPEPDPIPALDGDDSAREIEAAPEAERPALLERYVRRAAAALLKIGAASLKADRSLRALGLDSLNALRLRNQVESELGLAVEPSFFLRDHTIVEMARELAVHPRITPRAIEEGAI